MEYLNVGTSYKEQGTKGIRLQLFYLEEAPWNLFQKEESDIIGWEVQVFLMAVYL